MKVVVPPIKSKGIKTKLVPWIMDLAPKTNGSNSQIVLYESNTFLGDNWTMGLNTGNFVIQATTPGNCITIDKTTGYIGLNQTTPIYNLYVNG